MFSSTLVFWLLMLVIGAIIFMVLVFVSRASGVSHFLKLLFFTQEGLEMVCGDKLQVLRTTTNNAIVLNPFSIEGGLVLPETGVKIPGFPIGMCGDNGSGGVMYWDEIQLYQNGITGNANSVVLGEPGEWKSSLSKFELALGAIFGYNQMVMDRTGEYTALAHWLNRHWPGSARIVRFSPDPTTGAIPDVFINPMDPAMDLKEVRIPLITAMILVALGKDPDAKHYRTQLGIREDSLLYEAIVDADEHYGVGSNGVPLLATLQEKLRSPTATMAENMGRSQEELKELGYDMFLAVRKMTEGKLKGTFHKPTTPGILQGIRLLVLNCEGVKDERVVLTTMVQNFFLQTQMALGQKDPSKRIHRYKLDEVWDMLPYPGFVDSLRVIFKQSGKMGIAVEIIMHNKQDADVSTDPNAVAGLFADSAIRKCYKMNAAQLQAAAGLLKLNEAEVGFVPTQQRGHLLVKINDQPGIRVQQRIWPEILPLTVTRDKIERHTELPMAQELLPDAA